jgi:outer membrane lipoprotein SlyB
MKGLGKRVLIAAALLAAVGVTSAPAQQTMRVRGTIEKVDGNKIVVKSDKGAEITLTLTANAKIVGVAKARLADIKSGDFVGSAAMPQADGSQKALEVHIFAESMRGTGEGHRPYTTPGSTMTNGTVGDMVTATSGNTLTVKYKDGEKKIVVGPDVPVVRYVVADRSELKPGAHIVALNAVKKPDGSIEAPRINVGRDGLVPKLR